MMMPTTTTTTTSNNNITPTKNKRPNLPTFVSPSKHTLRVYDGKSWIPKPWSREFEQYTLDRLIYFQQKGLNIPEEVRELIESVNENVVSIKNLIEQLSELREEHLDSISKRQNAINNKNDNEADEEDEESNKKKRKRSFSPQRAPPGTIEDQKRFAELKDIMDEIKSLHSENLKTIELVYDKIDTYITDIDDEIRVCQEKYVHELHSGEREQNARIIKEQNARRRKEKLLQARLLKQQEAELLLLATTSSNNNNNNSTNNNNNINSSNGGSKDGNNTIPTKTNNGTTCIVIPPPPSIRMKPSPRKRQTQLQKLGIKQQRKRKKQKINKTKKKQILDTLKDLNFIDEFDDDKAQRFEPLYCSCKQIAYGDMVQCSDNLCIIEWFHYECVGLKEPPEGKWICPECKERKKREQEEKRKRRGF